MKRVFLAVLVVLTFSTPCLAERGMNHYGENWSRARDERIERTNQRREHQRELRNERRNSIRSTLQGVRERNKSRRGSRGSGRGKR